MSSVFYFTSLAVSTIYIGAHKGLTGGYRQQLSVKEGLLAPVAASVSLFSVYLVLKYLPDLSFQTLLDGYFFLLGSFAISGGAATLLKAVPGLGKKSIKVDLPSWLLLDENGDPVKESANSPADIIGIVVGVSLAAAEVATHHSNFTLSNLVACMVATDILQLIGIRSFRTAVVLLVGLLLYDVFWVFYSSSLPVTGGDNVMLTVATSDLLNAPTRLLFPRAMSGGLSDAAEFPYSLLGLGDVAVPGLLACLALRYDASRCVDLRPRGSAAIAAIEEALAELPSDASRREVELAAQEAAFLAYDKIADADDARRFASTSDESSSEEEEKPDADASRIANVTDAVLQQKTYFNPLMMAYVAGLILAFVANSVTGLGQPALLYLCPITLGAVFLTAATRRDLGRVWSFVDLPSTAPKPFKKK